MAMKQCSSGAQNIKCVNSTILLGNTIYSEFMHVFVV